MKKSEFLNEIRKIIREEVRSALKMQLAESTKSSPQKSPNYLNKYTEIRQADLEQKPKSRTFSKDPILNSILSETAESFSPNEWNNGDGFSEEDVPTNPSVPNFLNRDYSKLMQKIDEKRKAGNRP